MLHLALKDSADTITGTFFSDILYISVFLFPSPSLIPSHWSRGSEDEIFSGRYVRMVIFFTRKSIKSMTTSSSEKREVEKHILASLLVLTSSQYLRSYKDAKY